MARRKGNEQLTPLELDIMKVVWELGGGTVQSVQEHLAPSRGLAYTTVQTMLNILCRKGKVKRTLVDRAYRYRPAITRQKAVGNAVRDLVQRAFGGDAEALVMNLVETRQLSPEAIRRLQELAEEIGDE